MSCVTQFHSAMEEFNKALQDKKYVDAANQLERVRAAYIISTQVPNLRWEFKFS